MSRHFWLAVSTPLPKRNAGLAQYSAAAGMAGAGYVRDGSLEPISPGGRSVSTTGDCPERKGNNIKYLKVVWVV